MKLAKRTIEYKGRHFPAVEASLTKADWDKIGCVIKTPLLFADEELLNSMGVDVVRGEGSELDKQIFAYCPMYQCEHFCDDSINSKEFVRYVLFSIRDNYGRISNNSDKSSK